MFSPGTKLEEAKEAKDRGPFALGYAYEGPLRSAYAPPAAAGMSTADPGESIYAAARQPTPKRCPRALTIRNPYFSAPTRSTRGVQFLGREADEKAW